MSLRNLVTRWMGAAPATTQRRQGVQARYDNAQNTQENKANWWSTDYLSAKSANSLEVRRQLRIRSRYEVFNNPYLFGIANNNADDVIDKGPTLQVGLSDKAKKKQVEQAWQEWANEVGLTEKLRTLKLARTIDGEGFWVLKSAPELYSSVKLFPLDIEADQVTTPQPRNLASYWVDGLTIDRNTGRVLTYDILDNHPGDMFWPDLNPLSFKEVPAKYVIHWFPKFRPGQVRGVPVFTSALDLFTELRAFRRATLRKAEIAANLTGVLETDAPPPDGTGVVAPDPLERIPLATGFLTTLYSKQKLHEFQTGTPSTTYEMFQEKCLGEACRPLSYPLNLALGTSQKFNFSSSKLDFVNYRHTLDVERYMCEVDVMNKLFRLWFEEAILVPKLLPAGLTLANMPWEWHWPGYAELDPLIETEATLSQINGGMLTWKEYHAKNNRDWREVFAQMKAEKDLLEQYELSLGEPLKKQERINVDDPNADPGKVADQATKKPKKAKNAA